MTYSISAKDEWARDKRWLEDEVRKLRAALEPFTWQTADYKAIEALAEKTGDPGVPLTVTRPFKVWRAAVAALPPSPRPWDTDGHIVTD